MRVSTKGQVTIPKEVRASAAIGAGSEVEFLVEGYVITPAGQRDGVSQELRVVKRSSRVSGVPRAPISALCPMRS